MNTNVLPLKLMDFVQNLWLDGYVSFWYVKSRLVYYLMKALEYHFSRRFLNWDLHA